MQVVVLSTSSHELQAGNPSAKGFHGRPLRRRDIRDPLGEAAELLCRAGIDPAAPLGRLNQVLPQAPLGKFDTDIPYSPQALLALHRASAESDAVQDNRTDGGRVLIGLLSSAQARYDHLGRQLKVRRSAVRHRHSWSAEPISRRFESQLKNWRPNGDERRSLRPRPNVRCSRRAPVGPTFERMASGICIRSSRAWRVRALAAELGR